MNFGFDRHQTGTWQTGTWQTGTWQTGTWQTGTWQTGTWDVASNIGQLFSSFLPRNLNRLAVESNAK
jgi:hypothetical protein